MVLQSAVTWIKTSCCVESSDYRARRRAFFMTLRSTMFWFTEPWIGAPNTNGSLIWNNFQDQTFTAKVAISPKNIGKMPQNLLKKIFWKINFIKMIKFFICVAFIKRNCNWDFFFQSFMGCSARINWFKNTRNCMHNATICIEVSGIVYYIQQNILEK